MPSPDVLRNIQKFRGWKQIMGLGKMLAESAERYAEHIAVIHGDRKITYRELDRAACALGNHLRSLGIGKGDKIALML
ncbi:MAG: AMP-binding protein, partial [Syntrophales bacterium]